MCSLKYTLPKKHLISSNGLPKRYKVIWSHN